MKGKIKFMEKHGKKARGRESVKWKRKVKAKWKGKKKEAGTKKAGKRET